MERITHDGLSLFDVPTFFAASKNQRFRAVTLLRAQATAEAFTSCGIASANLQERFDAAPEAFRVTYGDLTSTGQEFAKAHYGKWLASTDRWKQEITLELLKRALLQRWEEFCQCNSAAKGAGGS
ncbi:hypothetical protein [Ideonella sp. BN130291]|uniref:hypothetical protein n=1 Tax=Ideonella sp. BN130291 TaxID=3112940 RepID=UPI002E25DE8B|nr:hypothetical protein [Ideonella sp. BN130291]